MSTSVEKITNYKNFNKNPWLIEFFREHNIKGILEAGDNQYNELEQVLYDMYSKIWLDYAEGVQLDILGIHLDLNRIGQDDENYRALLKTKIQINVSSGQPERLIDAVRILFDTQNIEYIPFYPAKVVVWNDGTFIITIQENFVLNDGSDNLIDNNGDNIVVNICDENFFILFLQVVPSGVGLLLADNLIENNGNYIITMDGYNILVKNYAENF